MRWKIFYLILIILCILFIRLNYQQSYTIQNTEQEKQKYNIVYGGFDLFSNLRSNSIEGMVQSTLYILKDRDVILFLGNDEKSDYIRVKATLLFNGLEILQRAAIEDSRLAQIEVLNYLTKLGKQYEGKKIRVTGEIKRTKSGRKYIIVSDLKQIEYL